MELTNEEKIGILNQHIKNVLINKYNVQIAVIAEESATVIDQTKINDLNSQMSSEQSKYNALLLELESLQS